MLSRPSDLPVVLCGPDAEALIAKAYGRPLVVAHVRDMEQRDVMADAALISRAGGPAAGASRGSRTSTRPSAAGCCARSTSAASAP